MPEQRQIDFSSFDEGQAVEYAKSKDANIEDLENRLVQIMDLLKSNTKLIMDVEETISDLEEELSRIKQAIRLFEERGQAIYRDPRSGLWIVTSWAGTPAGSGMNVLEALKSIDPSNS